MFVAFFFKSFIMQSTLSLQHLAPLSAGCPAGHTAKVEYRFSIFEGTNKGLGKAPESTINRVNSFNLSSFLSNFPENLTLDSTQKKILGIFWLLFK